MNEFLRLLILTQVFPYLFFLNFVFLFPFGLKIFFSKNCTVTTNLPVSQGTTPFGVGR